MCVYSCVWIVYLFGGVLAWQTKVRRGGKDKMHMDAVHTRGKGGCPLSNVCVLVAMEKELGRLLFCVRHNNWKTWAPKTYDLTGMKRLIWNANWIHKILESGTIYVVPKKSARDGHALRGTGRLVCINPQTLFFEIRGASDGDIYGKRRMILLLSLLWWAYDWFFFVCVCPIKERRLLSWFLIWQAVGEGGMILYQYLSFLLYACTAFFRWKAQTYTQDVHMDEKGRRRKGRRDDGKKLCLVKSSHAHKHVLVFLLFFPVFFLCPECCCCYFLSCPFCWRW